MYKFIGRSILNVGPIEIVMEFYDSDVGEVIIPTIDGSYINKAEGGELVALGRNIGHPQPLLKKLAEKDYVGLGLSLIHSNLKHAGIDPVNVIIVIGRTSWGHGSITYVTDKGELEIELAKSNMLLTRENLRSNSICRLKPLDNEYVVYAQIADAPFIVKSEQREQLDVLYVTRGERVIYGNNKWPTMFRLNKTPEQFASTEDITFELDRQTGGSYALSDDLGDTLVFISVPS